MELLPGGVASVGVAGSEDCGDCEVREAWRDS